MTTISPTTLLDDLHPSRFLKVADLLERWMIQQLTVTISRLANEDTIPNPKQLDPATHKPVVITQPVLYFTAKSGQEFPRGYLLSAGADIQALKSATGAREVQDLTSKKITIKVSEWKGKAVLRIDPKPVVE